MEQPVEPNLLVRFEIFKGVFCRAIFIEPLPPSFT